MNPRLSPARRIHRVLYALFLNLLGLSGCLAPAVKIVIKNDSGSPIQDSHLWFKAQVEDIPVILPGHSVSITTRPPGESNLEFEFKIGEGDWRHAVIPDLSNSDTFVLTIGADGACSFPEGVLGGGKVRVAILMRQANASMVHQKYWTVSRDQIELWEEPHAISLSDAPAKGLPTAPVALVEFCDFEDPACADYARIASKLLTAYPTQIRVIFKHCPQKPESWLAHAAALAAGEQGKFWEMHDLLFAHQDNFTRDNLVLTAKQLNLINVPRFEWDLDSGKYRQIVERDRDEGELLRTFSPPRLYVNQNVISGARDLKDFKRVIDFVLARGTSPRAE